MPVVRLQGTDPGRGGTRPGNGGSGFRWLVRLQQDPSVGCDNKDTAQPQGGRPWKGARGAVDSQLNQVYFQGTAWRLKDIRSSLLPAPLPEHWVCDRGTAFCAHWQPETLTSGASGRMRRSVNEIAHADGIERLPIRTQ